MVFRKRLHLKVDQLVDVLLPTDPLNCSLNGPLVTCKRYSFLLYIYIVICRIERQKTMNYSYINNFVLCSSSLYSISDEWMSANKSSFTKTVQLTALTQSERISLMEHLNYLYKFPTNILPSSSINSSSNTNENYTTDEINKKS